MPALAMFPLGTVLLPGGVLPLHVFEPRYRELVHACLAADEPEFGVVLIERGSEVGGGDVRRDVGCVARIVDAAALPEGRMAVVAVGTRRIRVTRWLADDPYPRAAVDDWPDRTGGHPGDGVDELGARIAELTATTRRLLAMAAELGDAVAPADVEAAADPTVAVYQLATVAPLGPADRYDVLRCAGVIERAALLTTLLADAEATLRFRLQAP